MGSKVTTDAGLLAYRELDGALGLSEMGAGHLQDSRFGQNKQHGLLPLLRQSIYSRLAGYEDVNDAERLRIDPAMRHVVGGNASRLVMSHGPFVGRQVDFAPFDHFQENAVAVEQVGLGRNLAVRRSQ